MSGLESLSSSSSSIIKAGPKLTNIKDYPTWRKSMKNYLTERKLDTVLKYKIKDFKSLLLQVDNYNASLSKVLFTKLGISLEDNIQTPKIKMEVKEDTPIVDMSTFSKEEKEATLLIAQQIKQIWSILYEALPSDIRTTISIDIQDNGIALWNWLEDRLHGNTVDVIYEVINELFTTKQSDTENFETYKSRIDELNSKLSGTNEDLSPTTYRFVLLTKLRSEYQPVVTSLNLMEEYKNVNGKHIEVWNKISLAIQHFERTVLTKVESGVEGEVAMVARRTTGNNKNQGKNHKGGIICHHCNEPGHIRPHCPKLKKVNELSPGGVSQQASMASIDDGESNAEYYGSSSKSAFTVSACIPRPLYSEVAYAGIGITARRPVITPVTTKTLNSSTPLKRLVRLNEVSKIKPVSAANPVVRGATESDVKSKQSIVKNVVPKISVSTQNRFDVLRNAKVPGPTMSKAGKPIETKLKYMTWGIDSMASVHCTGNKEVFATRRRCTPIRIKCANNEYVIADQVGTVNLRVRTESGGTTTVNVQDVFYSVDLSANLLSSIKLTDDLDLSILLSKGKSILTSSKGTRIPLSRKGGLLTIDGDAPAIVYAAAAIKGLVIETPEELMTTHIRLGHIGYDKLTTLIKSGVSHGIGKLNMNKEQLDAARKLIHECAACTAANITNTPHSGGEMNYGKSPGDTLHFDTFEVRLRLPDNRLKIEYGIAVVEPYTGLILCPRVSSKDLIADEIIKILKLIENLTRNKVKYCYTDGGTEFINVTLKRYCSSNGIVLHHAPPRTPKWNGTAERTVRIIKDGARALLEHASLPARYWYHAINHYLYVRNRTFISKHTNKTPWESFYGHAPSVRTVSIFGCDVYVWLNKKVRKSGTFAPHGAPGIYLGHCKDQQCPIVMLLESGKIIRNRAVDFREDQFNYSRAIMAGGDSIKRVINQSESDGVLSWYDTTESSDIGQTKTPTSNLSDDNPYGKLTDISESDENDDDQFDVDSILAHKRSKKSCDGFMYKIKWSGYDESGSTWQPADDLTGTADKILKSYRVSVGLEPPVTVVSDDDSSEESTDVGSH